MEGLIIKTIQEGGGGPPSTIFPELKVLKRATTNKQAIKASSPDKTFFNDTFMNSKFISEESYPHFIHTV